MNRVSCSDVIRFALKVGIAWFVVGLAFAPSAKVYQQGMVALMWLPAIAGAWVNRRSIQRLFVQQRSRLFLLLGFIGWALLSLLWAELENPFQNAKRIAYVLLFLTGMVIVLDIDRSRFPRLLVVIAFLGALAALLSLISFYGFDGMSLANRISGLGSLSNPNQGGHVIAVCSLMLLAQFPRELNYRLIWLVALLVMLVFLALTQSRSVWLGLIAVSLVLPFASRWRLPSWKAVAVVIGLAGFALAVGYQAMEHAIQSRGLSYRPAIFVESFKMLVEHPLLGLGAFVQYQLIDSASGQVFVHSHNLFLHVAVQLGLPGLLLWSIVWACVGIDAWRSRESLLGRTLFALWIYATVVSQFSVGVLWDTPRTQWLVTWFPIALWLGVLLLNERTQRSRSVPLGMRDG